MVSPESLSKVLSLVTGREPEAIARTLAMMAYNPAIGRVLSKGGVKQFQDLAWETVPKLYHVQASRDQFDKLHAETCQQIIAMFRTNRQKSLSYGQAQKPLNVFFKVYVDWAKQPTRELADKLAPFLHVPLDSLLMRFFSRELPEEYQSRIVSLRRQRIERTAERLAMVTGKKYSPGLTGAVIGNEFSLGAIDAETYFAWQQLFRALYPAKPVMLDIIWFTERQEPSED
jgi:hypothetical protein